MVVAVVVVGGGGGGGGGWFSNSGPISGRNKSILLSRPDQTWDQINESLLSLDIS